MNELKYPFSPILGSEEKVLSQAPKTGAIYFTTDTRKIYLDLDEENHKFPMGGNVGLFYGKMKPSGFVADDQKEFEFTVEDLIRDEKIEQVLVPNVNDLILNDDGCFYKVLSVNDNTFNTEKLTIAGTGGSGGGGGGSSDPDDLSSFKVGKAVLSTTNVLQGGSCVLQFVVKVTDDIGDCVTDNIGYYEVWINGAPKIKNIRLKGISTGDIKDSLSSFNPDEINSIDIASYLPVAQNISIGLKCYDVDGTQKASRTLPAVSVSAMELTWNYDNKTLNSWTAAKDYMTLSWSVSGASLQKNTYISIDDSVQYLIGSGKSDSYTADLKFEDYGLTHGSHTIKMWAEADLGGGDIIPTKPIYKNIIVAQENNNSTIISICLFDKELTQYNTVAIPVYIYNKNNIAGTYTVTLIENSTVKTKWENVSNLGANADKSIWRYTPLEESDSTVLTVSAGGISKSVVISVKGLGVKLEEKSGYAFKFKANEFSSNTDVQNWSAQDGKYKVNFSTNFDWHNGGIGSEVDPEFGERQFVKVKAGTEMEITYPVWKLNAPGYGKHLKVIFKATNCRDYDAHVLSCKADKKVIFTDKSEELFLLTETETNLTYSEQVKINGGVIELGELKQGMLNALSKESAEKFNNKYVKFDDTIYQCAVIFPDPNNKEDFYVAWYKLSIQDSFNGIELRAQNASLKTNNISLSTQYCEDTYIELEVEFTAYSSGKTYIKMWIDGVPCGYAIYDTGSDLFQLEDPIIKIGSADCDVHICLIKLYETELSIEEHMQNFYADAPNAEEMVRRYNRNNIMNASNKTEIDMFELAKKNPDLLVHHYEVPLMPTTKKTKIAPCNYYQYQGSSTNKYRAEGVMIKVQGTSSEKYVISAANLDTDFNYTEGNTPSGLLDGLTGEKLDGWTMSEQAIPINFACTKVNVASCENVNNYINQEWYNKFQPYQSVLRCKNPKARDTMQFTPGVIFITDNNKVVNTATGVGDNVFKDTPGYVSNPYAKMYSLGQMGNSKDNIEVFHDTSNPLECCIEVADNQKTQQCMINDNYNKADIGAKDKIFEFRYPEEGASSDMIDGWNAFVTWMAKSNPSPKYEKHENVLSEKDYKDFAVNKKTFKSIPTFIMNEDETAFEETSYNPAITTYYTLTDHEYGYTGLKLPEPVVFETKIFTGYRAENQKREDGSLWQKDYEPLIKGCEVKKYAGEYTHDTYEYRMAKMLNECEDHLVMDSILYHYLFIERHCMIDNVAKNTFWSTEDCQHWNMIKDYDNDTADGNDNQGKLTRTYGMEPTDRFNSSEMVFNASRSVWFNFCHGLDEALQYMYNKLANRRIALEDGTLASVWDYEAYLKQAAKIQSVIPERCWIEDYYRKYFRPNEIYKDTMYNSMLEGGQKKYQRKQFEKYQNIYLDTKYEEADDDRFVFRPSGEGLLNAEIPIEVYSDCYVYSNTGSNVKKKRLKRNTPAAISCPEDNLNNATMYIHPGSNITKIGSLEKPLGVFAPSQMTFAQGKKLREVIYGHENQYQSNSNLDGEISFAGSTMLEKLYLAGIEQASATALNLEDCTSLLELDATKSTFSGITLPDSAPLRSVKLQSPTALVAKNLTKLEEFKIADYAKLRTIHLENMDAALPNFSKDTVEKALTTVDESVNVDFVQYKITEAKWSLNNSSEMDGMRIKLLDKMLDNNFTKTLMQEDNINRLPYSAALTGNLTIPTEVYNDEQSLDIYNEYITNSKFANLDMDFEADNSKLYDVIIYDGDEQPFWKRKSRAGANLDETFLSAGPNGQFKAEDIYKSPSDEFEYEFLKVWDVKYGDGSSDVINGEIPTGIIINQDVSIYPRFKQTRRSYTITFKQKNPITKEEKILNQGTFEYGTSFREIINSFENYDIPYVDDPENTLSLYAGYNFRGYAASEGSQILLDEERYTVINDVTFYAVFELVADIRKITHPEWFNISNYTYQEDLDVKYYGTTGVVLSPKDGVTLRGKITIPAEVEHEGTIKPVLSLSGFGSNYDAVSPHKITHVFMEAEKNNKIYSIEEYAFRNCKDLIYFDFDNCAVRSIRTYAFSGDNKLTNTSFGNQLWYVYGHAFNGSLTSLNPVTVRIPASLTVIQSYGFGIMGYAEGSTLEIGSAETPSILNFSNVVGNAFIQNSGNKFKQIILYSNIHGAGDPGVIEKLNPALMADGSLTIIGGQ